MRIQARHNSWMVAGLVLAGLGFGLGTESTAFASSTWGTKPAWAASNPASRRARNRAPQSDRQVSPFSPGSNNVSLQMGQIFLMGDLAEKYADTIGFKLNYTYGVSDIFGFDSSFGFSDHSEGDFSMATLLTGLRTNLNWYDRVVPYAVFGFGFYKPSERISETASISPLLFGVHLGAGGDLQLTDQLFFGAQITFHDMFGTTKLGADKKFYDVGGTYTTFLLHGGVTF